MKQPNVLIVSAEDSSAQYAQRLLSEWKALGINTWGIGSSEMVDRGFEAFATTREMAVVGLFEVIKHYSRLKKIWNLIRNEAKIRQPHLAILMDYPDFNLPLARELKKMGIPVVYWIPPQVWAWRKSRLKKIKLYVDHLICVFPFEYDFYKKEGLSVHYFGHPLSDDLFQINESTDARTENRQKFGIGNSNIVIGLMPGSRMSEIDQHLNVMLETAANLHIKHKNLLFLLPVAPSLYIEDIKSRLGDLTVPLIIQKRNPRDVIELMDFVIVASGTATLLVAMLKKPMVIVYKFKGMTVFILKFLVKGIKYFGLPNLISRKKIVPELFQEEVTKEQISFQVESFLSGDSYWREVNEELAQLSQSLKSDKGVVSQTSKFLLDFYKLTP